MNESRGESRSKLGEVDVQRSSAQSEVKREKEREGEREGREEIESVGFRGRRDQSEEKEEFAN